MLKFLIITYIAAIIDLILTPIKDYDEEKIATAIFGPLMFVTLPEYICGIINSLERIFVGSFSESGSPYNYKNYLNRFQQEKALGDDRIVPITYSRWITFYNLNPSLYRLDDRSGLIYFTPENSRITFIFEFNKKDYKKAVKYLLEVKNKKEKRNKDNREYKDIMAYLDFVKDDIQKNNELSNRYYKIAEIRMNEIKNQL